MRKEKRVEVFMDRPYYIINMENGKINIEELSTRNLSEIVKTLNRIKTMEQDDTLIACCYKEYEGSFNVEVDKDEQYKEIFKYGQSKYKTFETKMCGI